MYRVRTEGIEGAAEFDTYRAAMRYAEYLDELHEDNATLVENLERTEGA